MSDLIERSQALNAINIAMSVSGAWENVAKLPSAQPERKKGKWIDGQCSICGCDIPAYIIDWKWQKDMDAKYCPSCGADMRGESDETTEHSRVYEYAFKGGRGCD